jgi:hypothetical protein
MTRVLSEVVTAVRRWDEHFEEFEHTRKGPPVVSETDAIGANAALDPSL